jgi:hypothetical protein
MVAQNAPPKPNAEPDRARLLAKRAELLALRDRIRSLRKAKADDRRKLLETRILRAKQKITAALAPERSWQPLAAQETR